MNAGGKFNMECIFIRKNVYESWVISSDFGTHRIYTGYSKREAIKKYREIHGRQRKHLITIDYTK